MERVLKQILSQLDNLEKGQQTQGQELKELREGQDALIERIGNLEEGQDTLREDLTKLSLHVEGKLTDQIQALYDFRSQVQDSLNRIEEKQNRQDARLDIHWQEIQALHTKRQ